MMQRDRFHRECIPYFSTQQLITDLNNLMKASTSQQKATATAQIAELGINRNLLQTFGGIWPDKNLKSQISYLEREVGEKQNLK